MKNQSSWYTNILFAILAVTLLVAGAASAQWSHDPTTNTQLGTRGYSNRGDVQSLANNYGGTTTLWKNYSSGTNTIRGQSTDGLGNLLWGDTGQNLITIDGSENFQVVSNSNGNFYIIHETFSTMTEVWVTKFNSSADQQWSVRACTYASEQTQPQVTIDQSDYLVIGWIDNGTQIYTQRINVEGTRLWSSDGRLVSGINSPKSQLAMTLGYSNSETLFAWCEGSPETGYTLESQKVDYSGVRVWAYPEDTSLGEGFGTPESLQIAPNDLEGIHAFWVETDAGSSQGIHYMLKGGSGANYVSGDGIRARGINDTQDNLHMTFDSSHNIFISYRDLNSDGTGRYVVNSIPDGNFYTAWGDYGRLIHQDDQFPLGEHAIVGDNAGGVFVAYEDQSFGESIVAQHFNNYGSPQWPLDNGPFTQLGMDWDSPLVLTLGSNDGVIATWICDSPDQPTAQKIDSNGFMGNNIFSMVSVEDMPNDQGGELIASWHASPLDNSVTQAISSYSVWVEYAGSIPLDKSHQLPGNVIIPASELAGLLKMEESDVVEMRTAGWIFAGQVPSLFQDEYSTFCPSFGDSTDTEIPLTGVRVVAHHQDPGIFWTSMAMAGYSIDNLAPGAPLSLTGMNNGTDVDLTWNASGSHDEDLAEYLVYRGTESGFTMDENTLLGSSSTTAFMDDTADGTVYYRVTAVDAHGNEGNPSGEVMLQLAMSAVGATPTAFSHNGNYPNPFNPMTQIAFDLPKTTQVRVTVYDASGRRIKTLVSETMGAGHHVVRWNGQDSSGRAVSSGVYFSRIDAGQNTATRNMTLVR